LGIAPFGAVRDGEWRLTTGLTKMTPKNPRTPRTTTNKRSAAQREQDLATIARLLSEGFTHREMTAWIRLNRPYKLSRTQITYDCAELTRHWRASAKQTIEDRVARQLAEIDAQSAEAWKAWYKSIGEVTDVLQEHVESETKSAASYKRVVVRKRMSHGDPRYMHIISNCVEARNRLLGLTRHKVELSGPNSGPVKVDATEADFDMEHIDKLLAEHYAERAKKAQAESAGVQDANRAATSRSE
jgi:hypothetical protein